MFRWAALVIVGAGIFDMVDGRVARATGQVTQFGGFFDSVIDRYSDVALISGCWSTTRVQTGSSTWYSPPW